MGCSKYIQKKIYKLFCIAKGIAITGRSQDQQKCQYVIRWKQAPKKLKYWPRYLCFDSVLIYEVVFTAVYEAIQR